MASIQIMLDLIGRDMTGGAFAGALGDMNSLRNSAAKANAALKPLGLTIGEVAGAAVGAFGSFELFNTGMHLAIDAGAQLQQAGTMASIAISDGAQHVGELETAIVNLANNSQYKIADVDMAFRVLGGLGFTTGQILGGMGQQAIVLAQAMGGPGAGISAADAAQLLGQSLYLFGNQGLTASHAADILTGAFYNNMMSVSDLQQFLGMAGGTADSLGVSFDSLFTFGSMLTPMFGSASSAGASLAYLMRNLAHPATTAMADEIQKLGLKVYDAKGNFVGLQGIMDQLFQKTAGMTQQQKMDVFGTLFNVRSGRAAMDLMGQTQASFDAEYDRINGRLNQVGQAQRDSTAINNTAIGSWNRLGTTVNDFFAQAGKIINDWLVPVYNWLNSIFSTLQSNTGFEHFLAVLLPVGAALSAIVIIGGVLVGIIALGLLPVLGTAALFFFGIIATAALVSATIGILTGTFGKFTGALSFLNPVVDTFRAAFNFLWNDIKQQDWQPLLVVLKALGVVLLVLVGIIVGAMIAGLAAMALAVLAVVDTVGQFSSWVGKMMGYIHELANVFGDVAILIKDVFTGNWGALKGDVEKIQRDWNADMKQLADQQAMDAQKAADKETADATEAALKKEAAQYDAAAKGDEKLRAQAQSQADYYQNLANTTKDKSLVTQYQEQAQMYQAQANGYAQQRDLANQNANALTAQANQVKANMTAITQSTMTAVVNNASDMSSKTTAQVRGMTSQTHAYMNEMRSDAITQAQQMSSGVAAQMQATANAAGTWGNDMANNFANGFSIGASSAETAAQRMAAKMAATLGHSKPTEGPLVDDDVWGLHMAQNFAQGMLQGEGIVGSAATRLAGAAAGAVGGSSMMTPGMAAAQAQLAQRGGGTQVYNISLYPNSKQVAQVVYDSLKGTLQQNGMSRSLR